MSRKSWLHFFSIFLFLGLVVLAVSSVAAAPTTETGGDKAPPDNASLTPTVILPDKSDLSPALRTITPVQTQSLELRELPLYNLPKADSTKANNTHDAAGVQTTMGPEAMPAPLQSFNGLGNLFGGWPPDTEGDIGPDYYVQWINLHLAIWNIDKVNHTATMIYGPVPGSTLFAGFGGPCETTNDGDPIALYDPMADRWFMSQFALPNFPNGPSFQCIAISKTGDPTGQYWRYQYTWPGNAMNDYPKFGVWPDAYYMTANQFAGGSLTWAGAGVAAFNRAKMTAGNPSAEMVYFNLYPVNTNFGGMLPADFDGMIPPPAGAPGLFVEWDDSTFIPDLVDTIRVWEFHVDFATPANSTFGLSGEANFEIPTMNVDPSMCNYNRACIPQPQTAAKLDAISDRLMYRLQYRNFGSYQTLVSNHTVDATSTDIAGIHWFELRDSGTGWGMQQEGVYHPDANNRWMGAAALDHMGDLALGYSVSSSSVYPSVRYAGRLVSDPPGTLPQAEASLVVGAGSQTDTSYSRWGDYSMMAVDPSDDCTFWYTQEYVAVTGTNTWTTRIGSFKFPGCSLGPTGTLHGTVTDAITTFGIDGATVQATLSLTQTFTTDTAADGTYELTLPVGTYTVTASAYGYNPLTESGVVVTDGGITTQNFALAGADIATVAGNVTDAITGWPLYAKITVDGFPGDPIWTDPVTGYYSINLVTGMTYTFHVEAWVGGYLPHSEDLLINSSLTQNFALNVDEESCSAPGYHPDFTYFEDFEADNGGYVISGTITSWQWGAPTSGPGAAHSGQNVWATNLAGNYSINENGYLTSPAIDLSGEVGKQIAVTWWQYLRTESNYDKASVEASKDGGTTWSIIYPEVSGIIDLVWTKHTIALDPTYAVANFKLRFHFRSDSSIVYPGWYVDDIGVGGVNAAPPVQVYIQNFDTDNGGFNTIGTASSWAWGAPAATPGPGSPHSAPNVWATNLSGNYNTSENSYLESPDIDLSAYTGSAVFIRWWQWLQTESNYDKGYVEVSNNGGTSWAVAYGPVSGNVNSSWAYHEIELNASYAVSNFRIRFHLNSDSSINYPGWYVDDISFAVGAPIQVACVSEPGGLVVGNVFDANTDSPMVGAEVTNDSGGATKTVANPDDLGQAPAFYTLFSPAQLHTFTASISGYHDDIHNVEVVAGDTIGLDFFLPAGLLTYAPPALDVTIQMGNSITVPFTLTNGGGAPATWELKELDKGMVPFGPIEQPIYGTKPFKQGYPTAIGMEFPPPPEAAPFNAGGVIQSWPTGIYAWGLAYDAFDETVWLSSPAPLWDGSDTLYEYTTGGTQTGRTHPQTLPHSSGPADMAYNNNTGKMWIMNVNTGISNCIFEIDPATGYTGNSICPGGGTGFATSQRGLAYDPSTDTYFAGGWNDLMVYRFTADGTILAQKNTGLAISGLAYNPDTEHLFVMVSAASTLVYVLDVANNYAIIGQFSVPGFSGGGGAGLEMSCNGHLWAVDQVSQVAYEIDSGETTTMCGSDVPWLNENPTTGIMNPLSNQVVQVNFNAGVPVVTQPGEYLAQLMVKNDTPYSVPNVPVTMTVQAPATWGKLAGTVTGLGYCDADPAPLADAEVFIEGTDGYTRTLITDQSGEYQIWLDQAHSPLTLTVTALQHDTGTKSNVVVVGTQTTTEDFYLRWLKPCMSVDPTALEVVVAKGYSETVPLQLINAGAYSTTFAIDEVHGGFAEASLLSNLNGVATQTQANTEPRQVILSVDSIPGNGTMTDVPAAPEGAVSLVVDDGSAENSIGVNGGGYAYQFIWLNRFTPAPADFPFHLNQIQILFPAGQATIGDPLDLVVYQDANGNPADGATLLATYHVTVQAANGTTWSVYNLPDPLPVTVQGDVLIGAINRWISSGVDPQQYPADIDTTASQVRSWVGWWNADPPDPAVLPPNGTFGTIDSLGFAGNWLIRGYGQTGGTANGVPWLSEDPISGTVDADSVFDVQVTFDSMTYTIGMYDASLVVNTDDPVHPTFTIPVVMQVVNPAAPVASFTTNSPVQVGSPMIFNNLSYLGSPSATEFEWDFGDGITQTVGTKDPLLHTYTTFGTFHVTLTICNVVGCSTDDAFVVVQPKRVYLPFISKD